MFMSFGRSKLDRNYAPSYCDWQLMMYRCEACEMATWIWVYLSRKAGRLVSLSHSARLTVNLTVNLFFFYVMYVYVQLSP